MLIQFRDARTSFPVIINTEAIVSITRGERPSRGHPGDTETAIIKTLDGGQYEVAETISQIERTIMVGRIG